MTRIVLAAALLLAGCSTQPRREAYLNTLVGVSDTELVHQLGVPSRTVETPGHKFLAYREEHISSFGGGIGSPFLYGGGLYGVGFGYFGGFPQDVVQYVCDTTFDVVDGRVTNWSLRGNGCT